MQGRRDICMTWGQRAEGPEDEFSPMGIRRLKGKQMVETEAERRSLKFRRKYRRMMTIFTNSMYQSESNGDGQHWLWFSLC